MLYVTARTFPRLGMETHEKKTKFFNKNKKICESSCCIKEIDFIFIFSGYYISKYILLTYLMIFDVTGSLP